MNIIETKNLTKTYGDFTAVSHLNLHIRKGSVYGFLGPNGAGKSTTMKMFLGLTRPTQGSFRIDGKTYPSDRVSILKEVGSFIEAPAFYGNLTGRKIWILSAGSSVFPRAVSGTHWSLSDCPSPEKGWQKNIPSA